MGESSSQTNNNVTFDLSSQVGVLQALYAVRTSELPSSKKNELRDDIFTYTKSGGDTRMREQLESQLKQLPLSEEFLTKKATTKSNSTSSEAGLNMGRQAPQFSVPSTPSSFTPQSMQKEQIVSEGQKTAPQPSQEQSTQPVASTGTQSVATNNPVSLEAQSESTPVPSATTPEANQSAQSTPISKPEINSEPAPVESGVNKPVQTNTDTSINRIREIKRAVNNAVGNPVNLVDIDNTLGRQYMSALLKAMQSVNVETGGAGISEMQELENIYQTITPILNREAQTSQAAEVSKQPTVAPTPPEPPVQTTKPAPVVESALTPESESATETLGQAKPIQTKSPITHTSELSKPAPVTNREAQTSPAEQPVVDAISTSNIVGAIPKSDQNYTEPNSQPTTPPANYQAGNEIPVSVESSTEQKPPAEQPASLEREVESATRSAPEEFTKIQVGNTPTKQETQTTQTPEPNQRKDSGSFKILPIAREEEESKVDYGAIQKPATRKTPIPEEFTTTATNEKTPPTTQATQDTPARKTETTSEWVNKSKQNAVVSNEDSFEKTPSLKQQTEGETIDAKLDTLKKQNQSQQAKTDPLYSPEIDAGLEQLLQEWSIFKSSGLFGTGPNGREHPLFKKIAPLMVQDVAAGRFEDARPEVVQSISDYMNGWRYEQGIVYQPGETFETYLRRVIKFILTGKP